MKPIEESFFWREELTDWIEYYQEVKYDDSPTTSSVTPGKASVLSEPVFPYLQRWGQSCLSQVVTRCESDWHLKINVPCLASDIPSSTVSLRSGSYKALCRSLNSCMKSQYACCKDSSLQIN